MSLLAAIVFLLNAPSAHYADLWVVAATNAFDEVVFIDKSTISTSSDGGKSFWYENVLNGARYKGTKSIRNQGRANCSRRTFAVDSTLGYGIDGKLQAELSHAAPEHAVRVGSVELALFTFVCGSEADAAELPQGSVTVSTADSYYAHPPEAIVLVLSGKKSQPTQPASYVSETARLKTFVDGKGGYRDRIGGYFYPVAGTYTDKYGGTVDNWKGYTYKDGSYKSQFGNYYDAKTKMVHLSSGDVVKRPDDRTDADVIRVFRDDVSQNHGYDKDFTTTGMMQAIEQEHPSGRTH